jgi:hypothetical protein
MPAKQGQPSENTLEPTSDVAADSVADTGLEGGVDEPNEALDAELDETEEASET